MAFSNSVFYGNARTNYSHGILAPPNVAVDSRRTSAQLAINDLTGIQGVAPAALQQYSGQDLATMGTPAMSTQGIGSPEIATPMATAIEMLTIFRAKEVFPGMLGPGGVAPLTPTNEKAIYFDKLVFNQQLPDVRPLRGRVNFGTAYRQQRISTMRDFGIGLEFTYQFLKGREGPLYLRLSIEQLNNAVVDHLLLMAYDTLQSAIDWGAKLWDQQLISNGARLGSISVLEFLRRDTMMLGAIQKEEYPLESLIDFIRNEQAREGSADSNALVMHHRIRSFFAREIPTYMEFIRAGEAGPAAVKATPEEVLNSRINGYALNVVRANSVDDAQEFPFMQNEVRYGEFYVMESDVDPENDPSGEFYCSAIDVYNQDSDSNWSRIKVIDALKHSGRFSENPGEPIGIVSENVAFAQIPDPSAYDMFTGKDGEVARSIGDLNVPKDRLVAIARAIKRVSRTEGFSLPEASTPERGTQLLDFPSERGGQVLRNYPQTRSPSESSLSTSSTLGGPQEGLLNRIEKELFGTWEQIGDNLKLTGNQSAALVSNQSLKCSADGYLDKNTSHVGACYALAMLKNCNSLTAEQDRAHDILLHGLTYVDKSGTSQQVGARFKAFTDHMIKNNVLPNEFITGPFTVRASPTTVAAVISAYIKSDSAKPLVFGSVSYRDFTADISSTQQQQPTRQRIGSKQQSIGAAGEAPSDASSIPEGPMRNEINQVLGIPLNLTTMELFVANKIPLPFRVVLLRPYIRLITYGMIACYNGAQHVYYGLPIFSWLSDGHSQVTRGVLSYSCGSAVQNEKTIFHLPNVLIADIAGGWGITWCKGGQQADWDRHDCAGDMLVLLEPLNSPLTRTTEIITAYGSFSDVSMLKTVPLNKNEQGNCFLNREWIRTWYNIRNENRSIQGEVVAAYSEGRRSEHMICWNGGYRLFNPKSGTWVIHHPSGPFAAARWYGPGMVTAFRNNKRPPTQEPSHFELMGK